MSSRPSINPRFERELLRQLPLLRGYALSLTRESADCADLIQDTALRAWANAHKFEVTPLIRTEMRNWLYRIMRNRGLDIKRRHSDMLTDSLEEFDMDDRGLDRDETKNPIPETMIAAPVQEGVIWFANVDKAFGQLSSDHQDALLIEAVHGMSHEDAAIARGVAQGTIKSRTNRARARLVELVS